MAEASASSCSGSRFAYKVFLSFRGKDTRKTFTDHLYLALMEAGILTFRDDNEIEAGEDIKKQLDKAIQQSQLFIVVFSEEYVSSTWCLDELEIINNRRKAGVALVLPIFYYVHPCQVSSQSGSYIMAFAKHERHQDMDKLARWRTALEEVSNLSGMVLNDQPEAHFVQDVIKRVRKEVDHKPLHAETHSFGIESHVNEVNSWLQDTLTDVRLLIINGIGGVGKTTIAKIVFNQNYGDFQGSSFLANVRETSETPRGLLRLQNQLLSEILKGKSNKVSDLNVGIMRIKDALCCRRVLIVLDDVDHLSQFDAFLRMKEWLSPGSKMILTTRNRNLFNGQQGCWTLPIKPLDDSDSFKLFSLHAFGQGRPLPENLADHSKRIVSYCGGLPLALRVLGSSLPGKSTSVWEKTVQQLQAIPDGHILEKLRISFDSLENDRHENLFLHIACFFTGMEKEVVVKILDGCDFQAIIGVEHLIYRSLIDIDEHNKIGMHDLLRDMGREIVRQQSPDDPGKRSRLWKHRDSFAVLSDRTGTETIKGLTLDMRMIMKDDDDGSAETARSLKRSSESCVDNFPKRRRLVGNFFSQLGNYIPTASCSSSDHAIKTEAFRKMGQLNVLKLIDTQLEGGYEGFPQRLVCFCWHGFHSKSLPTGLYLDNVVLLDLRRSSLQYFRQSGLYFPCLKILNLSHSHLLIETPDFRGFPSLERLKLKDCVKLEKINEFIGVLERLVLLNLKGCKKLRKLPSTVASLKELEKLILIDCSELKQLPKELYEMKSLKVLLADGITWNELRFTSASDNYARELGWHSTLLSWLRPEREVQESVRFSFDLLPGSLVRLSLSGCKLSDADLPNDFSFLSCLQHLTLSGNPFASLPKSITRIPNLTILELQQCCNLLTVPELPSTVQNLNMEGCTSVTHLPYFFHIHKLNLLDCRKLVEVEGAFKIQPINQIEIETINMLRLCNLEYMEIKSLELKMISCQAKKVINMPVQVLYESCGVFTVYLPGNEIPAWYSHQDEGFQPEGSLGFWLDSQFKCRPGKIIGLNFCTLYQFQTGSTTRGHLNHTPMAGIEFAAKHLSWTFSPSFYALDKNPETETPAGTADMLWLSHWKFEFEVEDGDEVKAKVIMPPGFRVKKIGIDLVYEEEMESVIKSCSYQNLPPLHIPPYQDHPQPYHDGNLYYYLSHNKDLYKEIQEFGGRIPLDEHIANFPFYF